MQPAPAVACSHAILMLLAMAVGAGLGDLRPLAVGGLASLGWWTWQQRGISERPIRWGGAQAITTVRVALVASLAPLGSVVPWGGVLVLVIFVLDGLDGWWARRTGTATAFGAAYDQEADAFLVAMGSLAVVQAGLAPGWVLLTGALRYGYVLAVHGLRLHGEAPRSNAARYVFAGLVITMAMVMIRPGPFTRSALLVASVLLVGSFARSLWWSWRGDPAQG